MIRIGTIASLALAVVSCAAAPARAQVADPIVYHLASPPSDFEWGCFGPCLCPVMVVAPLTGTFSFRQVATDPLYTYYEIGDVRWKAPAGAEPVSITGSGSYRRGGEVALLEQLTLDLSFNGGPPQHFDSGLRPVGAPFPEIETRISLHAEYCLDSVLVVDAGPLDPATAGTDLARVALTASPNPFASRTDIGFALPRDAAVSLSVYDVTGRRVRSLLANQRLAAGTHAWRWDGRLDTGAAASPGLYLLRLDGPWGRTSRMVVKLE
jgi:hypothetical protein